jgi:hypothetical protein
MIKRRIIKKGKRKVGKKKKRRKTKKGRQRKYKTQEHYLVTCSATPCANSSRLQSDVGLPPNCQNVGK